MKIPKGVTIEDISDEDEDKKENKSHSSPKKSPIKHVDRTPPQDLRQSKIIEEWEANPHLSPILSEETWKQLALDQEHKDRLAALLLQENLNQEKQNQTHLVSLEKSEYEEVEVDNHHFLPRRYIIRILECQDMIPYYTYDGPLSSEFERDILNSPNA